MSEYFAISVKEQGPVLVTDQVSTDRLTIIGPALNGPTNKPIRITNQAQAEKIFGPLAFTGLYLNPDTDTANSTYSYNELVRAYSEAVRAGARDVYLVRVGGVKASASGSSAIGGVTGVAVEAIYAGYHFNGIVVTMGATGANGSLTVAQPAEYGGTVTYSYDNTMTLQQLISKINSENKITAVRLFGSSSANLTNYAVNVTGAVTLEGGTYGTEAPGDDNASNKFTMYTNLTAEETGTFDSITDFETDLALLVGIYLDDQVVTGSGATSTTVAQKFAEFCANQNRQHPTHGFIGLRPLGYDGFSSDKVTTHILNNWESASAGYVDSNLKWIKAGYFMDGGLIGTDTLSLESVDYGAYISVVGGPDIRMSTPGIGLYQTSPVSIYAGMVSALPSEQAATKQRVPGSLGLSFSVREKQLRRLVNGIGWSEANKTPGKGAIVMLRTNEVAQTTEVAYDVTFANDRLPAFADLQPQRVVAEAIRLIKRELTPFLGDAFNAETQMAMEEKVRRVLDSMVESGKLFAGGEGSGYQFSLNGTNPLQIANNEVEVQLVLWPALQIKKIRITTTVRKG